mmetsp:Transcript_133585/g.245649  ORF Transcript_133585/g.245649 Transcript_133585/m.245649 type:complete len:92 (+) Transcript_133585:1046-1321(+)
MPRMARWTPASASKAEQISERTAEAAHPVRFEGSLAQCTLPGKNEVKRKKFLSYLALESSRGFEYSEALAGGDCSRPSEHSRQRCTPSPSS